MQPSLGQILHPFGMLMIVIVSMSMMMVVVVIVVMVMFHIKIVRFMRDLLRFCQSLQHPKAKSSINRFHFQIRHKVLQQMGGLMHRKVTVMVLHPNEHAATAVGSPYMLYRSLPKLLSSRLHRRTDAFFIGSGTDQRCRKHVSGKTSGGINIQFHTFCSI